MSGEWWHDHDEVIAFARWYWQGPLSYVLDREAIGNLIDFFEKPWKWTSEYEDYRREREDKLIERITMR